MANEDVQLVPELPCVLSLISVFEGLDFFFDNQAAQELALNISKSYTVNSSLLEYPVEDI